MIQTVLKRDGRIVGFNEEKIVTAIRKAMLHTDKGEDLQLIRQITDHISFKGSAQMTVEAIQDLVEMELMKSSRKDVAQKYIAYRNQRSIARKAKTRDMFLEIINIKSLDAISAGGLGNFSAVDLEKVLAGKKASVNYGIGDKTENVTGSCSPKDLETMLQLTYLTFTAPRRDDDAFASYKNRNKAALQNQELNPNVAFGDSIQAAIYMHHPRAIRMKSDMIDKIDYDKLMEMYKDRYKDASDFTFIFVGNIDIAKDKDLIAEYLGALPAINRKETFRDTKLEMRKGTYKNEFIKQQETPKSSVFVVYNGKCKYNQKNNILMSMTSQILDLVYTEKVREEEGGTYGVYVGGSLSKYPKETALLQIIFDTAPDKKDKLMKIIFAEAENLAKAGPSDANLKKVKEYMLKKHTEDLKENRFWLGSIDEYIFTGVDMIKDYENLVNSITAKEVQKFADDLMKQKNEVEVTMVSPEKK